VRQCVLRRCGVNLDDRSQQQVTALGDKFLKKLKTCFPPNLLAAVAIGQLRRHDNMMTGAWAPEPHLASQLPPLAQLLQPIERPATTGAVSKPSLWAVNVACRIRHSCTKSVVSVTAVFPENLSTSTYYQHPNVFLMTAVAL
jgi:hypothetical protein